MSTRISDERIDEWIREDSEGFVPSFSMAMDLIPVLTELKESRAELASARAAREKINQALQFYASGLGYQAPRFEASEISPLEIRAIFEVPTRFAREALADERVREYLAPPQRPVDEKEER